jgi:hypothetical protein
MFLPAKGGAIKLYQELTCPLDGYELKVLCPKVNYSRYTDRLNKLASNLCVKSDIFDVFVCLPGWSNQAVPGANVPFERL